MPSHSLPELLAPAGSPDALRAAVKAGADAVYFGGTLFNARMNAKNFTREDIAEAVRFCHANGVKAYVTFNTLLTDRQMKDALSFAEFLYRAEVDALIVTDLGLISLLRRYLPDFPLHASTQLSGHNADAANYLADMGLTRMVCARELSEENLKLLCRESRIEIEAFVHGALCVSHSGQCLLSAMLGGRSGNRGECAQPCRMAYGNSYPLSLKDNCLAGHLRSLVGAGVASLKLEGRMKSPDYVAAVVSVYRRLLDEGRDATAAEIADLAAVFSREGFTDGYFTGQIGKQMLGVRTEADKQNSRKQSRSFPPKDAGKRNLPPVVIPPREGKIPENAAAFPKERAEEAPLTTARFYNPAAIPENPYYRGFFDIIYLPLDRFDPKKANGVLMPPVIPDREREKVAEALRKAKEKGAVHLLVGNLGHLALAKESGLILHGDFRCNLQNRFAVAHWLKETTDVILSPELLLPQIRDLPRPASVIVYGRLPVMLLEKPVGRPSLRDRTGAEFPILQEGGRDILLNSVPIYMADYADRLKAANVRGRHFIFTVEGVRETESVIDAYRKGLPTKKAIRRIK